MMMIIIIERVGLNVYLWLFLCDFMKESISFHGFREFQVSSINSMIAMNILRKIYEVLCLSTL